MNKLIRVGNIYLKVFTKIYAMAGIRIGYMLSSNEDIINNINKIYKYIGGSDSEWAL